MTVVRQQPDTIYSKQQIGQQRTELKLKAIQHNAQL